MTEPAGRQLDLFDGDEIAPDESFGTAQRVWLDRTSWVEHVPGWLSGSQTITNDHASARINPPPPPARSRYLSTAMVLAGDPEDSMR